MSLMRQIALLLVAVLLLALAGAVGVNLHAARDTLQAQLRVKNNDNAQSLALALSQQRGNPQLMELLLAAQFDTGFYQRVRLLRADDSVAFEREAVAAPQQAPAWFAAMWPIESTPGVAQVSDGWKALGRVEVVSQVAYAHDEMWRGSIQSLLWLLLLGALALALAAVGVRRLRRPLDATVAQAHALVEGRYIQVDEPAVPELRRLVQAMNSMVERVRALFEAQAAQVDELRRQAHEDVLTGVAHRTHFLQRLNDLLHGEESAERGNLLLVRFSDLAGNNRVLGRETSDAALRALAGVLRDTAVAAGNGAVAGRLNGADFALALPGPARASEAARDVGLSLRVALLPLGERLGAHVGAVPWVRGGGMGALMAQADLALAHAESGAPFTVHVMDTVTAESITTSGSAGNQGRGEGEWHRHFAEAMAQRRVQLAAYPVLDAQGGVVHWECPLRVQLSEGAPYEPAMRWLPMAARGHWLPQLDLMAVRLALQAIADDRRPRAINLALASLSDGGFAAQLRHVLEQAPVAARSLWLEVSEGAAVAEPELLHAYATLLRPLGVHLGIEHAGHALQRAPRLYESGLDYVKLDASLVRGVATDEAVRRFVVGSVNLLRSLALKVYAEGVDDVRDAAALWTCGIDAVTGPWATAHGRR